MSKYVIGDIVEGKVTGIEKYGIFLSLNDGNTGLIHISEISDSFVRNVLDYAEMNETIKAKVIDFSENNGHLKLSIKGMNYRENGKSRQRIFETAKGFSTLKSLLGEWVDSKSRELEEKK